MNADSVGHLLDSRPDKDDLITQNILQGFFLLLLVFWWKYWFLSLDDRIAPSIQSKQKILEKRMRQDQVGHLLESRPDSEELETHNIRKSKELQWIIQLYFFEGGHISRLFDYYSLEVEVSKKHFSLSLFLSLPLYLFDL